MRFPDLLVQVKRLEERLVSLEFDMRQLLKELRKITPHTHQSLVDSPLRTILEEEGQQDGDPTLF